jgi:MATE family multidrug resistance protein
MHRKILNIALPSILTNITTPLLGLIDSAIVGHLGSARFIAATALGTTLINMAYWGFGFLRMSTGGLAAQAYGRGDALELRTILLRSVAWALAIALAILLLHRPVLDVALLLTSADGLVEQSAALYFNIVVWGAPAVLIISSVCGWFIGCQNARVPLYVAVLQNVLNIIASMTLVFGCGLKIEGVAWGTVIAQYVAMFYALYFVVRRERPSYLFQAMKTLKRSTVFDRLFMVSNRDIFVRSVCVLAVTSFFTFAGAKQGDVVLAANALLMQLFLLFSYFMDGFAYAAEALCGQFFGASNREDYDKTIRALWVWGGVFSVLTALVYAGGGTMIFALLTDVLTVQKTALQFLPYIVLVPLFGFLAFIYDGVFIGTLQTRAMLQTMGAATLSFFLVYWATISNLGNHGLWVAFLVYLFTRSFVAFGLSRKI